MLRAMIDVSPSTLEAHRGKLREIFRFWNWPVDVATVSAVWAFDGDLSLAVWHVPASAGADGYWVISEPSGVLPVDWLEGRRAADSKEALRKFGERWRDLSVSTASERIPHDRLDAIVARNPRFLEQDRQLRRMLALASSLLLDFAGDAERAAESQTARVASAAR